MHIISRPDGRRGRIRLGELSEGLDNWSAHHSPLLAVVHYFPTPAATHQYVCRRCWAGTLSERFWRLLQEIIHHGLDALVFDFVCHQPQRPVNHVHEGTVELRATRQVGPGTREANRCVALLLCVTRYLHVTRIRSQALKRFVVRDSPVYAANEIVTEGVNKWVSTVI